MYLTEYLAASKKSESSIFLGDTFLIFSRNTFSSSEFSIFLSSSFNKVEKLSNINVENNHDIEDRICCHHISVVIKTDDGVL